MAKIVYNACYGGFNLSDQAILRYAELKGLRLVQEKTQFNTSYWVNLDDENWYCRDIPRDDPALAQVVEELGDAASGHFACLRIRELAPGTKYHIDEYDGFEAVITVDEYE